MFCSTIPLLLLLLVLLLLFITSAPRYFLSSGRTTRVIKMGKGRRKTWEGFLGQLVQGARIFGTSDGGRGTLVIAGRFQRFVIAVVCGQERTGGGGKGRGTHEDPKDSGEIFRLLAPAAGVSDGYSNFVFLLSPPKSGLCHVWGLRSVGANVRRAVPWIAATGWRLTSSTRSSRCEGVVGVNNPHKRHPRRVWILMCCSNFLEM